jgi:hypothetical protein
MSAVFGRCAMRPAVLAFALLTAASGLTPASADSFTVAIDKAQVMKLPERVATIVVGNPLIADATLQRGGILVVTGKGYGATNLLALDREGQVVLSKTLQVQGPGTEDVVTVYRGVERETYSCAPACERRITLGDSPAYFNPTLGETVARSGSAAGHGPQ